MQRGAGCRRRRVPLTLYGAAAVRRPSSRRPCPHPLRATAPSRPPRRPDPFVPARRRPARPGAPVRTRGRVRRCPPPGALPQPGRKGAPQHSARGSHAALGALPAEAGRGARGWGQARPGSGVAPLPPLLLVNFLLPTARRHGVVFICGCDAEFVGIITCFLLKTQRGMSRLQSISKV